MPTDIHDHRCSCMLCTGPRMTGRRVDRANHDGRLPWEIWSILAAIAVLWIGGGAAFLEFISR